MEASSGLDATPSAEKISFLDLLKTSATSAKPRYFVSVDSHLDVTYGFATLQEADQFIETSGKQFGKDWRVGWLWRVRGLASDLRIVDKHSKSPKGQAKKL